MLILWRLVDPRFVGREVQQSREDSGITRVRMHIRSVVNEGQSSCFKVDLDGEGGVGGKVTSLLLQPSLRSKERLTLTGDGFWLGRDHQASLSSSRRRKGTRSTLERCPLKIFGFNFSVTRSGTHCGTFRRRRKLLEKFNGSAYESAKDTRLSTVLILYATLSSAVKYEDLVS